MSTLLDRVRFDGELPSLERIRAEFSRRTQLESGCLGLEWHGNELETETNGGPVERPYLLQILREFGGVVLSSETGLPSNEALPDYVRVAWVELPEQERRRHEAESRARVLKCPVGAVQFEPPALSDLLAGSGSESYAARFKSHLDSLEPNLASQLWRLESSSPATQRKALGMFLEYACTLQNMANIELGRAALLETPPRVRRDYLAETVRTTIDLTDEWQLRRLLEILGLVDVDLARELASTAAMASDPDIAEAGADLLSLLATAD